MRDATLFAQAFSSSPLSPCRREFPCASSCSWRCRRRSAAEPTTIVDLAKSVFQVAVSHRPGHLDEERRLSRDRFVAFFGQQRQDQEFHATVLSA
jgi:hypothetical protein